MSIDSGLQIANKNLGPVTEESNNNNIFKRIILVLLVGVLLATEQTAESFSAGAAVGGVLGGFAAFMVLAHFIHQRHDRARGEHDLDIDTTYGPAAKRYMRDKVAAQRELKHRNKHSKHHREQHAHRNKRLERKNRAYLE